MRIKVFGTILLVLVIFIAGCSGGGINLDIMPTPIEFSEDEQEVEVTVEISTTGFGSMYVDQLVITMRDNKKDKDIYDKEITIDEDAFAVGGLSFERSFTLSIEDIFDDYDADYYKEHLEGEDYFELQIMITGSEPSSATASVVFK